MKFAEERKAAQEGREEGEKRGNVQKDEGASQRGSRGGGRQKQQAVGAAEAEEEKPRRSKRQFPESCTLS